MTHLKAGDPAPDFVGKDQQGKEISLSGFRGRKLVLYFYPKDDTPGCTAEACNLRDNYAAMRQQGYEIAGVSPDSEKSHQKFISKFQLPFPLIADTDQEISKKFGVWGPKQMYGRTYDGIHRTTFIIDEQGIIEKVIDKVDTKAHAEQILP